MLPARLVEEFFNSLVLREKSLSQAFSLSVEQCF
nr:MAG TPA: hypothetical protein [Microviridae sp.]